jgi:curved DNA-binding protein CbpA
MRLEEAAEILGVSVDTPIEVLKQNYRRLALHWHPDKVGEST